MKNDKIEFFLSLSFHEVQLDYFFWSTKKNELTNNCASYATQKEYKGKMKKDDLHIPGL
jgi:hypothetical protein